MTKKWTISDIAQAAGVSKATVSRVMNNPEIVEEGTRERILSIMREARYAPSATARNLSRRTSSTVGVIVPEIGNAFFGDLFTGIEEVVSRSGLSLLYSGNGDRMEKDFEALGMMSAQRVKGVLYVPAVNYPAVGLMDRLQKKLDDLGCPVVCIDRHIGLRTDSIRFHDRPAVAEAVRALAGAGHDRIALINGNARKNILAVERYQGYLDGLERSGLELDPTLVYQGEYEEGYARAATEDLLNRQDPPTAVITCNNSLSKGYLRAVYGLGRPNAFVHIGLDRLEMLEILRIPGNYILRNACEMGRQAAKLLLDRLDDPGRAIQDVLLESILVRETF